MEIGVLFPQLEFGPDSGIVRDFAQAVEDLGYSHLVTGEHVLGTEVPEGWPGPAPRDMHHEVFVVLGYMAAITRRIQLVTEILILPQRQTALVAKQAADLDVLSDGRLRLGIGIGWNPYEYQALGENFHDRGQRIEEQIALMRALWTQDVVDFEGRWHHVRSAGLNPLPIQRPIPIWMAAGIMTNPTPRDTVLRRVARLADGWFPLLYESAEQATPRLHEFAREAGRDPSDIGLEGRIDTAAGTPEIWAQQLKAWEDLGAAYVSVNTLGAGLRSPDEHIDFIRKFKGSVGR